MVNTHVTRIVACCCILTLLKEDVKSIQFVALETEVFYERYVTLFFS